MATTDLHALAEHLLNLIPYTVISYSTDNDELAFKMVSGASQREGCELLKRAGYRCKCRRYPGSVPEIVVTVR